jgi:hypothetical protein
VVYLEGHHRLARLTPSYSQQQEILILKQKEATRFTVAANNAVLD